MNEEEDGDTIFDHASTSLPNLDVLYKDGVFDKSEKNYFLNVIPKISADFHGNTKQQKDAILQIKGFLNHKHVKPSDLWTSFATDFENLLKNPKTDISIKHDLLSLADNIMELSDEFTDKFSEQLLYSYIFQKMQTHDLELAHCLPVISRFVLKSPQAFTNLFFHNYIGFLLESLQHPPDQATEIALYSALQALSDSKFFGTLNPDSVLEISTFCLSKLIPSQHHDSFLSLRAPILSSIIKSFSNIFPFVAKSPEFMSRIIESGVSSLILSLLTVENLQSLELCTDSAIHFLCQATQISDDICFQMEKCDVVLCLSQSLLNIRFFENVGIQSLLLIYNTFVACCGNVEFKSYIFSCSKNQDFLLVLYRCLENGSAKLKQQAFSILAQIVYVLSGQSAIDFFSSVDIVVHSEESESHVSLELHKYLQLMISMNQSPEDIVATLVIAWKFTELFDSSSPIQKDMMREFYDEMMQEEMFDSLNDLLKESNEERIQFYTTILIDWMKSNQSETE